MAHAEIKAEMSVNDVIKLYPKTLKVFHNHGMDSCCGGAASVEKSAIRDGVKPEALLMELNDYINGEGK